MNHKDLDVWKEAITLSKDIYNITSNFPKNELYNLTSQIRKTSISIPSNIAEGCARNSRKELIQFLNIALGSTAELETQIIISKEVGLMNDSEFDKLTIKLEIIRKKLVNLIKFHRSKLNDTKE